ncbi:MAG: phosphoribosylformylglycinamidine synthase II [Deltaproteobacteria bacterium CG11_big_fil_rev_8_21_14_0_20_42_23]|nr:MAG: phosphoribosylformylglycinamidine synthase II [Deltaproteobacteria bacterium CG11_big_fil_rev_8_21_14_0_20_42_23]PJC64340.1 MAG: phosphoribosylformylglycinamidine synthase subunit PurL [Deltaproteobacteria bacterium CG_4_9_14_0_2_um_filter_42_21]
MTTPTKITPELIAEHGLSQEEYKKILKFLEREPSITELGICSVMWSEHCSYKSSRIHLKKLPTKGPQVLQGPGENAGVVDIGDGKAVCFKMESHNHPSYIEPYQGAATGVGGILRDVFTMGARPIALLNSLRFGSVDHPKTKYLVNGVVSGIGGYGNTMGIPTVGGECSFDACYNGNILVNAFCIGLLDSDKIFRGFGSGVGNPVIYVGSKTGRDGIHGATMASDEFDESSEEKRPTVQVGDPFTEKLLLEACLELMKEDAIVGIQDMGAAGLTSSSFEMADRAGSGMKLNLDFVPQREENMTAYEMMLSESQERMLIVAQRGKEDIVKNIFEKWDLDVAVIGEVTDSGKMHIEHRGEVVVDMPIRPLVDEAPLYDRPAEKPSDLAAKQELNLDEIPEPKSYQEAFLTLIESPNLYNKAWIWQQYDHMVMTNSLVLPGADAAVVRIKDTKKAIALSADCNSRYCYLAPYTGAALAVAESARNLSCVGAKPLAITDCLNFGNPERKEIMWQFTQSLRGMAAACEAFSTPIVSGNVSFYNETSGEGIYPTPAVAMVGLLEDAEKVMTPWWKDSGDMIVLLGKTELDLGASEYLSVIHQKVAGFPPSLNFEYEKALQALCRTLIERKMIKSAHDVSDGGLAICLAESCLTRSGSLLGVRVNLQENIRMDALLFGETASRIVVSVAPQDLENLQNIAKECGVNSSVIGEVGGSCFSINEGVININVAELNDRWRNAFAKRFSNDA